VCIFNAIFVDPNMLPKLQVDKGAIKFILSGANIMSPGLTSPGARMDKDLPSDTIVVSLRCYLSTAKVQRKSLFAHTGGRIF